MIDAAADVTPPMPLADALEKLIGSPDLCSRRWVWEQYDHVILGNTVQRPGGDAAVVRINDGPEGAGADVRRDAALLRGRSVRGRQAGGRRGLAQSRPRSAHGRWRSPTISISAIRNGRRSWASSSAACAASARRAARSIFRSCPAMSRSTTRPTAGRSCRHRPSAASVSLDEFTKSMTLAFKAEGEAILVIGETRGWLGQSLYLRDICGREEGAPPPVDLAAERRHGDFVRALIRDGLVPRCTMFPTAVFWSRSPKWRWRPASAPCSRRRRVRSRPCLLVRRGSGALCRHGQGRRLRRAARQRCRRAADCVSARPAARVLASTASGRCRSTNLKHRFEAGCRPIWPDRRKPASRMLPLGRLTRASAS